MTLVVTMAELFTIASERHRSMVKNEGPPACLICPYQRHQHYTVSQERSQIVVWSIGEFDPSTVAVVADAF
jgi:hypothetical protein